MKTLWMVLTVLFFSLPNMHAQTIDYYLDPCNGNDVINRNLTLEQLKQAYGEENIKTEVIWVAEGTEQEKVTYLFPDERNEMLIHWTDTDNAETPYKLVVRGEESDWYTIHDIRVGTPLSEIRQLNQSEFTFAGLGWDYGGTVWDWKGGELDVDCFDIIFSGDVNAPQELMGDMGLSSDNPAVKKANLFVYSFIIHLDGME